MADKWTICPECNGDGSTSAHLGVVDRRDIDWSHEEWLFYMNGGYDKECSFCDGSGKVLTASLEALYAQADQKHDDYLLFCAESGVRP